MVDPDDLLSRVKWWKNDTTDLDKILVDMSALSQPHPCLVADVAKTLLREPSSSSPGYLTQYQAVLCNVYAARGCCLSEPEKALEYVAQAKFLLAKLNEACKPLVALKVLEGHLQVSELAAMVEELQR
jgi:hypothetical protein